MMKAAASLTGEGGVGNSGLIRGRAGNSSERRGAGGGLLSGALGSRLGARGLTLTGYSLPFGLEQGNRSGWGYGQNRLELQRAVRRLTEKVATGLLSGRVRFARMGGYGVKNDPRYPGLSAARSTSTEPD